MNGLGTRLTRISHQTTKDAKNAKRKVGSLKAIASAERFLRRKQPVRRETIGRYPGAPGSAGFSARTGFFLVVFAIFVVRNVG
jgi:hypothetical protein